MIFFVAISILVGNYVETAPPHHFQENGIHAYCDLKLNNDGEFLGPVTFTVFGGDSQVWFSANLRSKAIKVGKHGFHIHQNPVTGLDCSTAGGHFNPTNMTHGSLFGKGGDLNNRHIGDLDNVMAGDGNLVVEAKFYTGKEWPAPITIYGENSIVGRSVVLHTGEDDLGVGNHSDSSTTGHAGSRLACCTIF